MEIPNPNIFREYDIRGLAEEHLTDEIVAAIGMAFGTLVRREGGRHIVVAGDVRETTPRIINSFAKGLLRTGMNVLDGGLLPTPGLYYSVIRLGADAGVMITGSHNPIEYNGIKLSRGKTTFHGEELLTLRDMILADDFEEGRGDLKKVDVRHEYVEEMVSRVNLSRKLRIVIDCGNGVAGPFALSSWERLGVEVIPIYEVMDGTFPNHLPDPTVPEYMVDLQKAVLDNMADFGVGYDGDADRMGAVDDKGRLVPADKILIMLARELLKRRPGQEILYDVKCSQAVEEEIKKAGGKPIMYKTGHSLIKSEMHRRRVLLAGEMSGHLFFTDRYFGFDDGLYASLRLAEILTKEDKLFSQIVDEMPAYVNTPEIRVECADDVKFDTVAQLSEEFAAKNETITIDGARVQYKDGWGLIRASNTQPVLVLRFEATNEKKLKEIIKKFMDKIKKYPQINSKPLMSFLS